MDAERGRKLTSLLRPLRAAAALAGVGDDSDEGTMALVVDVTGSDRADVWRAWDTEGLEQQAAAAAEAGLMHRPRFAPSRTGRWGSLLGPAPGYVRWRSQTMSRTTAASRHKKA